jgi:hypothetical protein
MINDILAFRPGPCYARVKMIVRQPDIREALPLNGADRFSERVKRILLAQPLNPLVRLVFSPIRVRRNNESANPVTEQPVT